MYEVAASAEIFKFLNLLMQRCALRQAQNSWSHAPFSILHYFVSLQEIV
jgi:hypothetical protein